MMLFLQKPTVWDGFLFLRTGTQILDAGEGILERELMGRELGAT